MVWFGFRPNVQPADDERKEEGPGGGDGISNISGTWGIDGVQDRQDGGEDNQGEAHAERDGPSSSFLRSHEKATPVFIILMNRKRVEKRRLGRYLDGNIMES